MEKFARVCAIENIGINEGWYIDGEWYSKIEYADNEAVKQGFKDFNEMYDYYNDDCEDNDFCYWSMFEDESEFCYDVLGNDIS